MKYAILFLFLPLLGKSQAFIAEFIKFSEVITVNGVFASDIYNSMKVWSKSQCRGLIPWRYCVTLTDDENKKIYGDGSFPYYGGGAYNGNITFSMSIECRDGRFKVSFDDFYFLSDDAPGKSYQKKLLVYDQGYNDGRFLKTERCTRSARQKAIIY